MLVTPPPCQMTAFSWTSPTVTDRVSARIESASARIERMPRESRKRLAWRTTDGIEEVPIGQRDDHIGRIGHQGEVRPPEPLERGGVVVSGRCGQEGVGVAKAVLVGRYG